MHVFVKFYSIFSPIYCLTTMLWICYCNAKQFVAA